MLFKNIFKNNCICIAIMNNTIPFLDLSREINEHKDEIMDGINTVVKNDL